MVKTYSFDIFDTCLVRKCGSSDNIFRIWADRALGEVDRSYLKDLINSRLNAEKTARRNSGKEDVSLDDIYRNLSLESFPNLSIPALKRLELDVERENLSPVRQVLDLIRDYRKRGKRILFISDMYLPSDFLRFQLRRFGFWEEGDRIYVSGEIGLTKYSGNLFRYIQREEKISRCSWKHVGDNTYSDYYVPKSMLIRSRRIYLPYTPSENLWQNDTRSPYRKCRGWLGPIDYPFPVRIVWIFSWTYCWFLTSCLCIMSCVPPGIEAWTICFFWLGIASSGIGWR